MEKPDARSGAEIFQKAEAVAISKADTPAGRCFVLAILAGMMIGMGAMAMLFVKADSTLSFAVSQITGGVCFSLGLICVIVASAELFTGNMLMVMAASSKKLAWKAVLKNWAIVYIGNLVGSLLLVGIILATDVALLNGGAVGDAMVRVAYGKMTLEPFPIFARGVMCNWLVCLAVWMGFAGRTVIDKIFTTIFPVTAFVACGFEHCVANMFILPMGVAAFDAWGYGGTDIPLEALAAAMNTGPVVYNIVFATLGNMVGGALLVGMMYWIAYRAKAKESATD